MQEMREARIFVSLSTMDMDQEIDIIMKEVSECREQRCGGGGTWTQW